MTALSPTTPDEWAAFLETDPMPLVKRLRFVAVLASDEYDSSDSEGSMEARHALKAIIPGDGQATPAMLDAVAEATGRGRIVQGILGVANTAPAARAALRRWAAKQ